MYKVKHNLAPNIFIDDFTEVSHKYPTRFSAHNFYQPKIITKTTSYSILSRGPYLWNNNVLNKDFKTTPTLSLFKKQIKTKLLNIENEATYF